MKKDDGNGVDKEAMERLKTGLPAPLSEPSGPSKGPLMMVISAPATDDTVEL
jgi:hypothetical protein